jgi:RNA polymerase sigma factor (sigma-70 family)
MFKIFNNSRKRKNKLDIDTSHLNELMKRISEAENFADIEQEFNNLYDCIVYQMWDSFSKNYIPPLSQDDLRDIFQEAWIKILNLRKKYNPENNVYSWIYVIKKNMILDRIRQIKRHNATSIDDFETETIDKFYYLPDYEPLTDEKLISEETIELIKQEINSIKNETECEIMKRRIILGNKLELISEEMGIPLSTIHKTIKSSLQTIRPRIEYLINN